jgi:spore coat protein H
MQRFLFLGALVLGCASDRNAGPARTGPTDPPSAGGTSADAGASQGGRLDPAGAAGHPAGGGSVIGGNSNGGTDPQSTQAGAGTGSSASRGGSSSGGGSGGQAERDVEVIPEPLDDASAVFDPEVVRVYDITIDPTDLALADANPAAEMYVPGSIAVDGQSIGPIGFRYKGSVGAFLAPCTATTTVGSPTGAKTGKCSIKIAFDHVDPEARHLGLKKLNFHAMNQDRSMLRERLAYGLYREMGIPAPRAMHARVNINGEPEGLFIAVEQIDGRFTRSRFTDGGDGNLFKEVWPMHDLPESYRPALETNEDSNPPLDGIAAFAAAAKQGSDAVERWVDRAYVARFLAADRVMANDDGSAHWWCLAIGQGNNPGGIGNHNYYWYEDELAGRFWLVPWDMDSSLGATSYVHIQPEWRTSAACTCSGNPPQRPTSCDPLFATWAQWTTDYENAVDEFLRGPFEASRVEQKLASWSAQIQPHVAAAAGTNGAPTESSWQQALALLRLSIESLRLNRGWP